MPTDLMAIEGSKVKLMCRSNDPANTKISWLKVYFK